MRTNLCAEFLIHADREELAGIGKSAPKVVKWLDKQNLPSSLLHLLQFYWPQKENLGIRHLVFYTANEIVNDGWQKECLRQRLLTIGSAPNGDYLVVRLDTDQCEVDFISHEEWDHEADYHQFYQPIAKSLDSLLYRLIVDKFVPADYFVAQDYNSLLEEKS